MNGYEFQGDNLLIARINLLVTYVDNMRYRWNRQPTFSELRKLANVIVWNFWQMDSRTGSAPTGAPPEDGVQLSLFEELTEATPKGTMCRVYNWRSKKSMTFAEMKEGLMR